jgi:HK97 family phage major capsid protein
LPPQFVGFGADGGMTIFGRPVMVTEFNATLGTVGDIVVADLSEYLFWEKGGVQEAQSIHVAFTTDEMAFRFIYRCTGQPTLAAPLTPYKGSLTTSPFVVLQTRS